MNETEGVCGQCENFLPDGTHGLGWCAVFNGFRNCGSESCRFFVAMPLKNATKRETGANGAEKVSEVV